MALPADVSHRLALFLCDRLKAAIPEITFAPERGVDQADPQNPLREPFAVPLVKSAEEINPGDEVYLVVIHLALQTRASETPAETESDWVRRMKLALDQISTETPGYDTTRAIHINGLMIVTQRPLEEEEEHNHGSLIELQVGCQLPRSPHAAYM